MSWDKRTVLIIGAGRIGLALYAFLKAKSNGVFDPIVIDPSDKFPDWVRSHITGNIFDDPDAFLVGVDYCVNLAPVYDPISVGRLATACVERGVHYLDVSEDVHVSETIRRIGEDQTKIWMAPHCGVAPGLINNIAATLVGKCDRPYSIDLRVGALPVAVSNEFRYACTWSREGLVNEYANPMTYLTEWSPVRTNAFTISETEISKMIKQVVIDGVEYESFPTSGGCSTLIESIKDRRGKFGNIGEMCYRSIRYKGHYDAIRKRLWMGGDLINLRFQLTNILSSCAVPNHHGRDIVLIYSSVSNGPDQHVRSYKIHPIELWFTTTYEDSDTVDKIYSYPISAIQRSTAGQVYLMLNAHYNGRISRTGYVRQESVKLADFDPILLNDVLGIADE